MGAGITLMQVGVGPWISACDIWVHMVVNDEMDGIGHPMVTPLLHLPLPRATAPPRLAGRR